MLGLLLWQRLLATLRVCLRASGASHSLHPPFPSPAHPTLPHTHPSPASQRYRYRLVVDESMSLGVLGPTGRGAAEHAGCAADDVEIVGGSLGETEPLPLLLRRRC